jgi:hypothetical protein
VPKLSFLLNNAVLPIGALLSGLILLAVQMTVLPTAETLAIVGAFVGVAFLGAAWWVRSLCT